MSDREPSDALAGPRQLARRSALMATGTVVSRITGVGRDIAAAAALGFYLVADAFSLGNSLPNILYILVIGGALNAVFVPQLVRRMADDADGGKAYADRLLTLAGVALLVLSVVAVLAAPWIVDLYTPADYPPAEYELAVAFARLCLPQIFFYGAYTMLSQVLNARGHFAIPMFAPIANNIVAITTFLLFIAIAGTSAAADGVLTSDQVALLGIGTTLGVIAQAVILIPVLARTGYRFQPRFDWRGAGLGKAGALATWTILLVLVNQLTYLVITRLATQANVNAAAEGLTAAGLTTYQKAHLVFVLPHSIITVSIVTAMLPALSRIAHEHRFSQVGHDIAATMRLVAALVVPVAAVLFVTGSELASLLFGYGAATTEQADVMGLVVSAFMIGLLPFTLFYVLLRGFYALEDTRTPFLVTVAFSALWLALAVPVFPALPAGGGQVAGLALTYGLSYWAGFVIAWVILARRLRRSSGAPALESGRTAWSITRMLASAVLAVGMTILMDPLMSEAVLGADGTNKLRILLLVVLQGALIAIGYLVIAWILRVHETSEVLGLLRRKVRRG